MGRSDLTIDGEALERDMRRHGIRCLSIRLTPRGVQANYRVNDYEWRRGREQSNIADALADLGLLKAPEARPSPSWEDLL